MEEMDLDSFNFSDEVVVLIQQRRDALPVVLLTPVAYQFLAVSEWHALLPVFHGLQQKRGPRLDERKLVPA